MKHTVRNLANHLRLVLLAFALAHLIMPAAAAAADDEEGLAGPVPCAVDSNQPGCEPGAADERTYHEKMCDDIAESLMDPVPPPGKRKKDLAAERAINGLILIIFC